MDQLHVKLNGTIMYTKLLELETGKKKKKNSS